jgi:hypothetical protein
MFAEYQTLHLRKGFASTINFESARKGKMLVAIAIEIKDRRFANK